MNAYRRSLTANDPDSLISKIGRTADGPSPREPARVTLPYQVGILACGRLADVVAHARATGLAVLDYPGGGWLVRRGWLVIEGRWEDMQTILAELQAVQDAGKYEKVSGR